MLFNSDKNESMHDQDMISLVFIIKANLHYVNDVDSSRWAIEMSISSKQQTSLLRSLIIARNNNYASSYWPDWALNRFNQSTQIC